MSNDYFQFKQFKIFQDRCSMKITTDAVLLGAWADVSGIQHALDVGAGSGILSLMIAQRSNAWIDAVEIDEPAARQACENISGSPWGDRISIHPDSFQHFVSAATGKYDLIISNPPYFKNSLKSPDFRKSKARHDVNLSYEELIIGVTALINSNGRFCVILPGAESENFTDLARIHHLFCYQVMQVKPKPDVSFNRVLLTFGPDSGFSAEKNELAIRDESGQYSSDYINITKDFYLAF